MKNTTLDPNGPVELLRAPHEFAANVAATALESEGIQTRVVGLNDSLWGGMGSAFSTVQVFVRRADRRRALATLRRLRAEAAGVEMPAPEDEELLGLDPKGLCVVCGYDMTGLERELCPECGTNLADESFANAEGDAAMARGHQWFFRIAVVVVLCVTAIVVLVVGGGDLLL